MIQLDDFLVHHGTTIMISTVVFALLSLFTAVMTRSSNNNHEKQNKQEVKLYNLKTYLLFSSCRRIVLAIMINFSTISFFYLISS